MPELPEVETVVRDLREAGLVGATIASAQVLWARTVEGEEPEGFKSAVKGSTIGGIRRRAKYIVVDLGGAGDLLIHLRMTGQLRMAEGDVAPGVHDRVVLSLADGRTLCFRDTRKFGRWRLVDDAKVSLAHLGPEPLEEEFTCAVLAAGLASHARMIKPLLLDQHFVAGIGNIYADEALWLARVHPMCRSNSLTKVEVSRLHRAVRRVLRRGIAAMGTTLGTGAANFYSVSGRRGGNAEGLKVFRRTGEGCERCGRQIVRIVVGQRSSHICPECQQMAADVSGR